MIVRSRVSWNVIVTFYVWTVVHWFSSPVKGEGLSTVLHFSSFFSPLSKLTTSGRWYPVSATIFMAGGIFFAVLAEGEIQDWAKPYMYRIWELSDVTTEVFTMHKKLNSPGGKIAAPAKKKPTPPHLTWDYKGKATCESWSSYCGMSCLWMDSFWAPFAPPTCSNRQENNQACQLLRNLPKESQCM